MTHTRPSLSQPKDYFESYAEADNGSSLSQSNTWNINHPLPWIVFSYIISVSALLLSMWALWINTDNREVMRQEISNAKQEITNREKEVNNKLTVSENHWRNIESDVQVLKVTHGH